MTKQELKKKRKQIVESKGYKEWEPQQEKLIAKRKETQKNAEIQKRKVELSGREDGVNAQLGMERTTFGGGTAKKNVTYNKPTTAATNTKDNVNKRFQKLIIKQEDEESTEKENSRLFQRAEGLKILLSENKNNLTNQEKADAELSKKELDELAKKDRKGRIEALKGRSEKTLQEAELYALTKRNQETETKVNESKGINKFLAANEYLGKEFAQNTLSSFGQIKATADQIQGRDKDLSRLEYAQKYQEAISPLGQNVNSRFLQNLGMAVEGVGQQTPQILLGASGAGALVGGFTEFSNTYNEMTLEDPNNKTKTMVTALLKGTVAGGLESTLGLFGGGKLDKLSKSQLAGIKNKLVRNAVATGYDAAGEITEEQLENMIGYVIDKAVNDKDITMEQAIQEAEATFKQTGLTTILMSALGLGGNTRREVNSIAERTNWVNQLNVTSPQKTELRRLAADENVSNEELYNEVIKIEQENAYQDTVYENVIKNAETAKKQQATIENKEVLNQNQQTTLEQGGEAEKAISKQPMGNEKYSIKMPNSNYKFEKTGDINSDNLDESMSKYFNNSEATQKLNSTLKNIMKDKNLSIKFDDSITDEQGNILDGKYENGSITINPNSTRAFEYIATHELTHAIGTKEMLNMVQNYRESNSKFNTKVETLLKNYDKTELTEEALADVSAQLFGTQEFIDDVKNKNPNLFQKIYNEIKYLWHQFRGYKNEKQFIEDLYNKWTAAYNSKEELNQTSKKLFAGTNAKNKNITTLKEALKMEEQGESEQDILKKTGWFRGNDTNWRFETDDSKISFKDDIKLEEDGEYYLKEFLNAKEIFEAYPELKDDVLIKFKKYDDNRVRGERTKRYALDYEYDEIHINNEVLKDKNELKSVLLHEIQHYIQGKEGFSRGANREYWQEKINDAKRIRDNILKDMEYYHKQIGYDKYKDELFKKADNKEIDFFDVANLLKKYESNSEYSTILKELRKLYEEANIEYSRLELQGADNLYRNTAGEQESREVQNRMTLNEDERRGKFPFITDEKTVYSDADKVYNIVKGGDNDASLSDRRNILSTNTDAKDGNTRNRQDNRNINKNEQDRRILQENKGQDKQGNNNRRNHENNRGVEGLDESSSFNLQKDNQGRTLTKEQQDYFKDSKVRDEKGNLLEVYHRTNADFNTFNLNKIGSATDEGIWGRGFYFSNKDQTHYGNNLKNVYLNIKNPFVVNDFKTREEIADYLDIVESNFHYEPNGLIRINYSQVRQFTSQVREKGHDGVIVEYPNGTKEIVAFNSNQIKNVDNLNPTENPDIRYAKQGNTEWQEYLEKNFKTEGTRTYKEQLIGLPKETDMPESMSSKLNRYKNESEELKQRKNSIENMDIFDMSSEDWIAYTDELNNINDRDAVLNSKIEELENIPDTLNNIVRNRKENKTFKEKKKESNAKFQKAFVNKYYEIDEIAKKTNNKKLTIALDNWIGATQQVGASIDGNIKRGTGQTNSKGEVIGESITEILKDVYRKKDISNLTDYMQNKLNIERSAKGKANLSITPEQSKLIVERYEKQKPYFKDVAKKMYKFYDNILQNCVDAGLGTEELKNTVREMYPSYFPIYKNMTELTSFIDSGEINNKMIKRAVGGQTDILAIDVASAEYVMGMNKKIQLNNLLVELKNSLEKSNQLEDYVNTELPADADDFAAEKPKKANEMIMQTTDGDKIATCYIDGVAHQFKISNEIYELLKPQDIKESAFGKNVITWANNLYRKMVTTYNPFFTLRNMVKDFQNGCYNTKYGALQYTKNYLKGIKEIFLNGEMNQLYKNVGLQGDTKYTKTQGILTDNELNVFQKYNPISLGNKIIDHVNSNIEMMGRMSEFISAIESGKDINEARYEASEITLNFKRGGEVSKTITRWGGTFFNSSVLAVDKTIKNITGKNGKKGLANFVTMGLLSGVGMSLINHLVYEDDEEYEQLPDYIKDGYWLIKKNDGSGTFYRIAKDQITTAIGSTARRIYQMAEGEEDIGELEDMFKAIFENLGVENPITSNMYAPIVQASTGKTWYGEELLSDYQETLAPELQYDYRTNEISKNIAEGMAKLPEGVKNIAKGTPGVAQVYDILSSPKKSDYVLQQYLGGVGKVILPAATPYAEQNYIEKEMTTNSVLKSKYPSMVYDEFDKAEMEFNSYGTNQDRYLYLTEATKQLGDYYKEIREVENDNTLSNEQKREKEYEIKKELNKAAKDILNNLENNQKTSETSKIGEKEYYKDTEGKWKTISEEDKIEGISTNTYAKYKNELKIATEKKREEENDEEATLDKKEKVAIINSSNYTSEEKKAMYEKSYGNQDSTYKNLSKITDVNIEAYLNYIQEEIKGDDDPNSTKKGKTISGSKKKNLLKYLNNPNSGLSNIEKVYIYGRSYDLNNSQKSMILKAVENSGMTYEEKKEFYLTLHNVYEEEDGSVRWK